MNGIYDKEITKQQNCRTDINNKNVQTNLCNENGTNKAQSK